MKKAFIFIDFDMLIRHFILSGSLKELEKEYDVTYVFHTDPTSPKKGIYQDIDHLGLKNYITFEIPRVRMGRWADLSRPAQLHNLRGTHAYKGMLDFHRFVAPNRKTFNKRRLLSLPGVFQLYKKRFLSKMGLHQPLFDFLRENKPDIIIHPTILHGYFINELNLICPLLNIPLVALMNSWDNPASKASVTGFPDVLVPWGEQTRQHAIDYMKMPAERIKMFGAAQMQHYRSPVIETDEELRAMFKVPSGKPVILYGGTSKSVMESDHLELLDNAIEDGTIPPCHIIYRPHPWRGGLVEGEKSFYELDCKHVTIDPFMEAFYKKVTGRNQNEGFDFADYEITKKLLHLVDAVISPLSTILLEGMIFGNPGLVLFIDDEKSYAGTVLPIAKRVIHFKDLLKQPGITECHDIKELPELFRQLFNMSKNDEMRAELKRASSKIVNFEGAPYGEQLLSLANELTA